MVLALPVVHRKETRRAHACTILSALNSVRLGNGVPSVESNMSAKRGRTMVDVLGRLQEAFAQPKTNPAIFAPNLSLENAAVQPLIQDAQTLLHRPLPCSSAAAAALKLYGPTSRADKQREISRAAEKEATVLRNGK
ncbi:hypothetical protein J437_LFUL016604 [Ladona fulva]|uniref:Uncharacterized protein n=1 Tax=Ladona fulva TaxID=123851 RepID=A0A8K0KNG0_LADFU|nr:hypothetical protein J437_LFUL016604 [Ladona fulva]